jgi:hypothetical protein
MALAATAASVDAGDSMVGQRGGELPMRLPGGILKPEALRFPTRLAVAGDELIVLDRYSRQAVTALDRVSGRVRRAFGRHGQGPAELFGPFAIAADGTGVVVLDASMNRLTYLSASEGSNAFRLAGVAPMTEGPFIDVVATSDGAFLGLSFAHGAEISVIDSAGRELYRPAAPSRHSATDPSRAAESVQGVLRRGDRGRVFIRTRRFASRIDILDENGAWTSTVWGPERFDSARRGSQVRFGYLDAAVTADGFLALYSGRTRESHPGTANFGSIIHEFDRAGNLTAAHALDSDIIAIAWHELERLLYAIRHDPEPAILVYRMP